MPFSPVMPRVSGCEQPVCYSLAITLITAYAAIDTTATIVTAIAIVCHGSPDEPQPHVAFLNHADTASSEAITTKLAIAGRTRATDPSVIAVVAVHGGLDAFGQRAFDRLDGAVDAGV